MTVVAESKIGGPTPVINAEAELSAKEAKVRELFEAAVGSAVVHCDVLDALRRARADLDASCRKLGERRHVPKLAERAVYDNDSYRYRTFIARWRTNQALDW